jgi:hypothetical protein
MQQDGTAQISMKKLNANRELQQPEQTTTIPQDRVAMFLARLNQTHFWTMPTDSPRYGKDGSQWILEGVNDGKYHLVARWSPDYHSTENKPFADAARMLLELGG